MAVHSLGERSYQFIAASIILACTVVMVFPLIWVVSMSVTSQHELMRRGGFVIIPQRPTFYGYELLWNRSSIVLQAFLVSVTRTLVGTLLCLVVTTVGAYVAARPELPGRKLFIVLILITVIFPGGMIPTFLVVRRLGMLNSIWALIVPMMVNGWALLIIKQFMQNIPGEINDSAFMDGAGEWTVLVRISVPMAAPALAAIGLFTAVGHWNAWFDALIYVDEALLYPLQLVLRNVINGVLSLQSGLAQEDLAAIPEAVRLDADSVKMSVIVVTTLPILCVYPFLQKYFTKGMYLGAVKG